MLLATILMDEVRSADAGQTFRPQSTAPLLVFSIDGFAIAGFAARGVLRPGKRADMTR